MSAAPWEKLAGTAFPKSRQRGKHIIILRLRFLSFHEGFCRLLDLTFLGRQVSDAQMRLEVEPQVERGTLQRWGGW